MTESILSPLSCWWKKITSISYGKSDRENSVSVHFYLFEKQTTFKAGSSDFQATKRNRSITVSMVCMCEFSQKPTLLCPKCDKWKSTNYSVLYVNNQFINCRILQMNMYKKLWYWSYACCNSSFDLQHDASITVTPFGNIIFQIFFFKCHIYIYIYTLDN